MSSYCHCLLSKCVIRVYRRKARQGCADLPVAPLAKPSGCCMSICMRALVNHSKPLFIYSNAMQALMCTTCHPALRTTQHCAKPCDINAVDTPCWSLDKYKMLSKQKPRSIHMKHAWLVHIPTLTQGLPWPRSCQDEEAGL
jgi:hypothetical protein